MSDEKLEEAIIQPSEANNLSEEASANQLLDLSVQAPEATTSELTSTTVQNQKNTMTIISNQVAASSVSN